MKKKSDIMAAPATRADLQSLEFKIDFKFDNFERKILDQFQLIRDGILTSNDRIVKELDDVRTNYVVFEGVSEEVRDKVENHEKRITKLEKN